MDGWGVVIESIANLETLSFVIYQSDDPTAMQRHLETVEVSSNRHENKPRNSSQTLSERITDVR